MTSGTGRPETSDCVGEFSLSEFRNFISGATSTQRGRYGFPSVGSGPGAPQQVKPKEIVRSAIYLLKTLPLARDAALIYLSGLFDASVTRYVSQLQTLQPSQGGVSASSRSNEEELEDAAIQEVLDTLSGFLWESPHWAPIISSWSMDLLGELSCKYASRAQFQLGGGLNEELQVWLSCQVTRSLIDLTAQCFSSQLSSQSDASITALLDTSIKHSPHFDWVVAHIGSCFPQTIISQVLQCGHKNYHFSMNGASVRGDKVGSVVGILGHLGSSHYGGLKSALVLMFRGIQEDPLKEENLSVVPYIIQLCSMSHLLLQAATDDLPQLLSREMIECLSKQAPQWLGKYFSTAPVLIGMLVNLLLQVETSGPVLIQLLLDLAINPPGRNITLQNIIGETSHLLLMYLIKEAYGLLRSRGRMTQMNLGLVSSVNNPLIKSFCDSLKNFLPLMLDESMVRAKFATKLMAALALMPGNCAAVKVLKYLLGHSSSGQHLGILVEMLKCIEGICPNAFSNALRESFHELSDGMSSGQTLHNVHSLVVWEAQNMEKVQIHSGIRSGITEHFSQLVGLLYCEQLAQPTVEILALLPFPSQLKLHHVMKLVHGLLHFFFSALDFKCFETKVLAIRRTGDLLQVTSVLYPFARNIIIRGLIEGALISKHNQYFGAHIHIPVKSSDMKLMKENQKLGSRVILPHSHSSVFHAGVIGQGLKNHEKKTIFLGEELLWNTQLLINTIQKCSEVQQGGGKGEKEREKTDEGNLLDLEPVAGLLVELLTPDVLYNGFQWPEEDFIKVTIERDLEICRKLAELPIVWDLLFLVASYYPALHCCSIILRAVVANLIQFWSTRQGSRSQDWPKQVQETQRIIYLMGRGQLLPLPFSLAHEIIPLLAPFEVHGILSDIWHFMRENFPTPIVDGSRLHWPSSSLASLRCNRKFTEKLRLICINNMDRLGIFYSKLLPIEYEASNMDCGGC